jgi:hypothetical protein
MATSMTKIERVQAALAGSEVDRVPVSAWGHDYLREWTAEGLAEATLEAYRRFDWDFVKVNPRATYFAEDWGARFQPSGRDDHPPALIEAGVKTAADLASDGDADLATVSEAGPAPMHATRLPFVVSGMAGRRSRTSSRRSAATRLSRQIATGFPSRRVRRQAGSQGRSQVRPRTPGKTLDSRFSQ